MLKNLRLEIIVIGILLLNIFVSHNFDLGLYKYFLIFKDSFQQAYLKEFFESITILGDSLWYFLISIFFIIIFLFLTKNNIFNSLGFTIKKIQFYNYLLFSSVLVSGLLAQIFKHILGRPRPGALDLDRDYVLNFFTLDSNFHSFPSGHATTIFSVAIVAGILLPKLKYFLYFFAIIIAFSRVVIGAHFITDIFGGVAVAFVGFKVSKLILSNYFDFYENDNQIATLNDHFFLSIVVVLISSILLTIGPTFDIFFSELFYFGKNQFLLQSYYAITIFFREIVISIISIYILILPILSLFLPIRQIYFGHYFSLKQLLYLWGISIFNLFIVTNMLLKNLWGRARPNEILELGGENIFTPWYQISTHCNTNCSFISGDAAVGFSLVIFYFLIKKEIYLWLALFFGFMIGLIRIMEGGHFLSDVTFSCIVIFILNLLFYFYYLKKDNG